MSPKPLTKADFNPTATVGTVSNRTLLAVLEKVGSEDRET